MLLAFLSVLFPLVGMLLIQLSSSEMEWLLTKVLVPQVPKKVKRQNNTIPPICNQRRKQRSKNHLKSGGSFGRCEQLLIVGKMKGVCNNFVRFTLVSS